MSEKYEHSPTPWMVTGWNIRTSKPEVGESPIAIGPFSPRVSDASVPPASVTANLEYIVRTVNSHSSLLEALEQIREKAIEGLLGPAPSYHLAYHEISTKALQKAKE